MNRAVRVLLDVNIFVGNIIAHDRGHQGTATQTLVDMVSSHRWGLKDKAQLIVSFEMIDTLETVLRRLDYPDKRIKAYCDAIIEIMRYGPEGLDPYLVLGGEQQFPLPDAEDARVLVTAFAAQADILVTDNLKDFAGKDALVVDTQCLTTRSGMRTLQAFRYNRANMDLIVAILSTSCNGCAWAWILRQRLSGRSSNRLDNAALCCSGALSHSTPTKKPAPEDAGSLVC